MEQFERAKRYYSRIKNIYEGVFSSNGHIKDNYDDDVISFFIHCYHVRDWIIYLNLIGIDAKTVDAFINENPSLSVCADLANGSKHCRLTRNLRTECQPHVVRKQRETSTWHTGDSGGEIMQSKYTILSGNKFYDALKLAEECIFLWSEFISAMQNKYKDNAATK